MKARRSRNLCALLDSLGHLTWKCAPKAFAIADFADLLKQILFLEPRCILGHKLLVQAIEAEDIAELIHIPSFF